VSVSPSVSSPAQSVTWGLSPRELLSMNPYLRVKNRRPLAANGATLRGPLSYHQGRMRQDSTYIGTIYGAGGVFY
jgi:hypothetical protein